MNDFDGFYLLITILPMMLVSIGWLMYRRKRTAAHNTILRIITWNLLFLLILLSSIFWMCETYYRFFVDTTDSFGLNKITQRWGKRHFEFNNYDWRDDIDYEKAKTSGKPRITFIGDSFTAGHGIKDVNKRFANLIRINNPELEVHVLASNGFETINQWNTIQRSAEIGYETDVVVLVYNLNDISWFIPKTKVIYDRIFQFEKNLNYFERESYFINMMTFRWTAIGDPDLRNYYDYVIEGYAGQAWQEQKLLLQNIINHLKEKNIKLLVVTFPFLHQIQSYNFRSVHDQLDEFWKSENVPHLDLLSSFENYKSNDLVVNSFDAHPNEFSHGLVSVEIEKFILSHK